MSTPPATVPPVDVSAILDRLETPVYLCDLGRLRKNLEILADAQRRAECKILLALKGFAMWSVFPIVREYLSGVATSSVAEARLGREEFCGDSDRFEVHAYAPAYTDADIDELVELSDHIVFNSVAQWQRHGPRVRAAGRDIECALRLNPRHSEVEVALYDPCASFSRLGITPENFPAPGAPELDGISGLHFHTLCELGSDALERTVAAVEERFGEHLGKVRWVNFGGGHHITRPDYDIERLVRVVRGFQDRHGVAVYLEPGEAIALNTGVLVASVLDVGHNDMNLAILDTSATAHMPDVLEMPYRPVITGAGAPGELAHTYRLGGLTCLAGDVIGDYSFAEPLQVGDKLVFGDMAHYTMVKNTTFNGVRLPDIATYEPDTQAVEVVRRFGYEDYKNRLS
ncbi:carboxynorspermidine decarboxylase [Haliangium ochraceum]|uniref:Carboxynorspermidine/carboxyspermidine decarboxylase n=1 Tax=Haliangium ochraceum (strain DSM 14365 / JCM 11303 / SMP-2) TaxID=502025 RepID=D0LQG5_HALO1|nr:carboxynorspermidine decarboxylase [Haliangium ochraceum]ACY18974.1 carboxynorspermidine decarboxylase [Haliangium ochraceum DSM 14365]